MNKEEEVLVESEAVTETDLDELISELEAEEMGEVAPTPAKPEPCKSFWCNIKKSWYRPKPKSMMAHRFQVLAGIVDNTVVASVTLPNKAIVNFKELPAWHWVLRFKLSGLKYETYV